MRRNRTITKSIQLALVCLVTVSILGAFPSIVAAVNKFSIGDTVEVITNLNVRTGPGTSYLEISDPDYPGYAPAGTKGIILSGPITVYPYVWWRVDFGPGLYTGWSVEGGLEKVIQKPNPPTPISPGSSSEQAAPVIDTLTPMLQWSGVSNADYYALAISKYPYGSSNIIYNPQQLYGTSHTVPSGTLGHGKRYRWNMQARNSAGWSDISSTLYFQTKVADVTLTLYVHEGSASGPVLSGARVSGQDGGGNSFDKTTNSSGYVTITGTPGTWSFTASKAGYDTNSWSQSITSTETRHAYLEASAPIVAPAHLSPANGASSISTRPTFQWQTVSGATKYGLYISQPPYGAANLVYQNESITGTSLVLPSDILSEGITYRWNMRAGNAAGWGPFSSVWSFSTQALGSGLADSPWPMFGHDYRHTGQASTPGPQTNNLKWSLQLNSEPAFVLPVIASDGTIYATWGETWTGTLYAVNPEGAVSWHFGNSRHSYATPAIAADGTIYVTERHSSTAGIPGHLSAINPDGTLKWSLQIKAYDSSPLIGPNGTVYIGGDNALYAINPDGTVKWQWPTEGGYSLPSSPAFGIDGSVIIAGRNRSSGGDKLYSISRDNGALIWQLDIPGTSIWDSSPVVSPEGIIYIGTAYGEGGMLYAVEPDGSLKWKTEKLGTYIYATPALGTDGTIYIGVNGVSGGGGALYAVSPEGQTDWTYPTVGGFYGAPAIDSDGTIYYAASWGSTDDSKAVVFALNSDGSLKWEYALDSWVHSSPCISDDATLYVGGDNSILYAFGSSPLSFTSLTPSTITTDAAPYDATLSAKGNNFNNVDRVTFEWSGAASGSAIWNEGDADWNAKVTVNSDTSMTLRPRVVETSPTWSGTVTWTVTLRDNTSATASRSFTVNYEPSTPANIYDTAFISDFEFTDANALSLVQIRDLLQSRNSPLAGIITDTDGSSIDPALLFYNAANQYSISPKVLLATAEKETTAITGSSWQNNYLSKVMGYNTTLADTVREQIDSAAWQFRKYLTDLEQKGQTQSGWQVGVSKSTLDGVEVTPANKAIAALFTYTPYAGVQWGGDDPQWGGNYLFYYAWYNKFHFIGDLALATHWAPVWYQDTDSANHRADYITNFDYDGDWDGTNNWDNLDSNELKPYIYYWVVETETHWFIGYADFHPRDWKAVSWHENDMEGCLLMVRKDGSQYGELFLMITQAHGGFLFYDASEIQLSNGHPVVFVEAKGHGVYGKKSDAYPYNGEWKEDELFPAGDGVIYYWPDEKDWREPNFSGDPPVYQVSYELKAINNLWDRRYHTGVFSNPELKFGEFVAAGQPGGANAPWSWDAKLASFSEWPPLHIPIPNAYKPDFFMDPAHLYDPQHNLTESFHTYIYKSYSVIVESFHPYDDNYERTWIWKVDGAETIRVRFFMEIALNEGDWIRISDNSGSTLQDITESVSGHSWSNWFDGDTIKITLHTDGSKNAWGFCADRCEYTFPDATPPTVSSISVEPDAVILDDAFTISYIVSDTGGSGLNRVELWRKSETVDWHEVTRTSIAGAGDGPYSGSFSDIPPSAGTYWYGIHVVDNAGNWAPEDSPISVSVTAPNTAAGNNVTVSLPDEGVDVTFSQVTVPGQTMVTASDAGPEVPSGFLLAGQYYDITTTADCNGPINVCITYDPATLSHPEENLRLYHHDGGDWQDVTTALDTVANVICGEVSSLSVFATLQILDNDPPQASNPSPDDGSYIADSTPQITVDLTDTLSGVDPASIVLTVESTTVSHTFDGTTVSYTPASPLSDGQVVDVALDASDIADNTMSTFSWSFTVDLTPPMITISGPVAGYYNTDQTVAWLVTDDNLDTSTVTANYPSPTTFSTDGTYQVSVSASDLAGNYASASSARFVIDKTPPTISGAPTTSPNANNWYNTNVAVHFTASDEVGGSGLASVTPDVTVTTEGLAQSITGTATDLAGNNASFTVAGINIDKTPPTITVSRSPSPNMHGWNNVTVSISYVVADALSGIDETVSDYGGDVLSGEGANQSASGSVTDLAGNTATAVITGINIDLTPPTITGAPTTSPNANNWYNTDVVVHFSASDTLSNLDSVTPDVALTSEGAVQSAIGIAVDKAGNSASYTVTGINIDKTPPVMTATPDRAPNTDGWYNANVIVTFTADDLLSGVDPSSITVPITLSTEAAAQSATGYATDLAGNTGSVTLTGINIDKTPPTITGSRTPLANAYGWNNTDVTVQFAASDALSGIASITADTVVTTEGAGQSVSGTAIDKAGNSTVFIVSGINIDKTPPSITINSPQPTEYFTSESLKLDFSASDALSDIDSVAATLDGSPVTSGQVLSLANMAGSHTLKIAASDKAENRSSATITFQVIIAATADVDPDTINLQSEGKWVTAYIEMPVGYDATDIDGATVMLNGSIPAYLGKEGWAKAEATDGNIMDHDGDGLLERMVKFDLSQVQAFLSTSAEVEVTVTGEAEGLAFKGIDIIRVIDEGKNNANSGKGKK